MIKLKYPPKTFRCPMERAGCRKNLIRLMEKQDLTLVELAGKVYGKNMRKQVVRMLYECGYSEGQIIEIMRKDKRQCQIEKKTGQIENKMFLTKNR